MITLLKHTDNLLYDYVGHCGICSQFVNRTSVEKIYFANWISSNIINFAGFIIDNFKIDNVQSDAINTDFSKAFNIINHQILLNKLQTCFLMI